MANKFGVIARAQCPECGEKIKIDYESAKSLSDRGSISCSKCGVDGLSADSQREGLDRHIKKIEVAGKSHARVIMVTAPIIMLATAFHLFGELATGVFIAIIGPAIIIQLVATPGKDVRSVYDVELERLDSSV